MVLCGAHKNHDSPALPEVLARFKRSGVTRHLERLMGYRILSQNSSPTPSAIRPATIPVPKSGALSVCTGLLETGLVVQVGCGLGLPGEVGESGTQLPDVPWLPSGH